MSPMRYTVWCAVTHGHDVTPDKLGALVAYADYEALQAKLDALMLEYCPDEMTPEQIENWQRHQRRTSESETEGKETT
jgi:hypothetical protein